MRNLLDDLFDAFAESELAAMLARKHNFKGPRPERFGNRG